MGAAQGLGTPSISGARASLVTAVLAASAVVYLAVRRATVNCHALYTFGLPVHHQHLFLPPLHIPADLR